MTALPRTARLLGAVRLIGAVRLLSAELLARVWAVARAGLGFASLCMTLGAASGLALLVMAEPAMRITARGLAAARPLGLSANFLDRTGRPLGHRGILHGDRMTLEAMSQHLVEAVLATEDRRFFAHLGIDPLGMARALLSDLRAGAAVQGGSTITQQLAKDLFLGGERTLDRKITELFLAGWLEAQLGKREILTLYLDRAYLGGNAFGVEAASRLYYGRSAHDLGLAEAASLAAILKSPTRYTPHGVAGRARALAVLDRMVATGAISRAERDDAAASPIQTVGAANSAHGHVLDWTFRGVQRLAAAGAFGSTTDLVVETSLDGALQTEAEAALGERLGRDGARLAVTEAAAIVMDLHGAIRAMVGGRDHARSQFNRATDALRQPGSAFKPIVYVAALAFGGLSPESLVDDSEICIAGWCPSNYARRFSGTMSLATALARSINSVAVRLMVEIGEVAGLDGTERQARAGRTRIVQVARALGLTTPLDDIPALPLGASGVTPLELTAAYGAFASGGLRTEPYTIEAVRSRRDGALLHVRRQAAAHRALAPDIVADMDTMLARAVSVGSGRAAALPGRATAGKTGTSSRYRDAWFVGFTGQLVAGIWFGNDDNSAMRGVTGGSLPAETWRRIMMAAHRDLPPVPLLAPTSPSAAPSAAFGSGPSTGGFRPVSSGSAARGFEVLSGAATAAGG